MKQLQWVVTQVHGETIPTRDVAKLRFDVAIPRLRLLFEYHGPQHFPKTSNRETIYAGEQEMTSKRDKLKRQLALQNGFTLIEIGPVPPHSRDRFDAIIAEKLAAVRPDLIPVCGPLQQQVATFKSQ